MKKAFTLIETVIFIIVMGICMAPLSILIANVVQQGSRSQSWATATMLAAGEMQRQQAKRYSYLCRPATAFVPFSTPFANYSYQADIYYINPDNLSSSVATLPFCSVMSSGIPPVTNYKRIDVIVRKAGIDDIRITSLVTNDW